MSEYLLRVKVNTLDITDVENGTITGIKFDNAIFKRTSETKPEKNNGKPKNPVEETKTCSKCNTRKPSSDFYPTKRVCKDCISKYNKEYNSKKKKQSGSKICPDCKTEKPYAEFGANINNKDGRQTYCRDCSSKRSKISKMKKESKPAPIELPGEKPVHTPEKNFDWNSKRDSILVANFDSLGVSGIFDKSLLPGFTMTEIRKRCQELHLIDEYGNPMRKRGEASG